MAQATQLGLYFRWRLRRRSLDQFLAATSTVHPVCQWLAGHLQRVCHRRNGAAAIDHLLDCRFPKFRRVSMIFSW